MNNKSLLENTAAISASFHQDNGYPEFYEAVRDSVSGFPGIWQYLVKASEVFTKAEIELAKDWVDWIGSIDNFVAGMLVE